MSGMIEKHKEWILETVDLLRQRKARPDFERICRMLDRFHGLKEKETKQSLDALVEEGKVLKVHFKGNISYRRLVGKNSSLSAGNTDHSTSHRIIQAIRTITRQTGDGVTFSELEQWMIAKNPDTRLVKLRLQTALLKEINAQTITKLPDNCYVLTESLPKHENNKEFKPIAPQKTNKCKSSKQSDVSKQAPTSRDQDEETKRGRPLSKRKKIKKTHGPDFEDPMPIRKNHSRDDSKTGEITCDFCSCTAQNNPEGKPEPLLTCKDCSAKVHPSCMDYSEELAQRALNSPWQCMDCKTCCICDGAENDDLILFCDACDKGYHMTCHSPSVANKPKGSWICLPCKRRMSKDSGANKTQQKKEEVRTETNHDGSGREDDSTSRKGNKRKLSRQRSDSDCKRPNITGRGDNQTCEKSAVAETVGESCLLTPGATPTASPRPCDTFDYEMKMSLLGHSLSCLNDDTTTYTDASNWGIDEVVKFFDDNGHKDHSYVFRAQEIDGPSLLLMRREDVLNALGLKLGPALKVYRKVVRIQQCSQGVS